MVPIALLTDHAHAVRRADPGRLPSRDRSDATLMVETRRLFKAEVIHWCGPWRSFEAVAFAILEWVEWFNSRRLLDPIGNVPSAEAEARHFAQAKAQALAA